jgi:glutathione S-transferase
MKIYNNRPGNIWTDTPFITAAFAKVKLEEVMVEDTKSKEYKAISLTGKCPALQTPEGILIESAAVARYVAQLGEGNLAGATAWEKANVNMWIDFAKGTINSHFMDIYLSVFGLAPVSADKFNNAVKELKEAIKTLNTHLEGKPFLVSNRVTVADIVVGLTLVPLYQTVLDAGFRKAMPHATQWIERLIQLPEVSARIGNIKFAAKALKAFN